MDSDKIISNTADVAHTNMVADTDSPRILSAKEKIIDFLATGFYSGKLPKMPGTWGTLVAFFIVAAVKFFFDLGPEDVTRAQMTVIALIVIAISIFVSNKALEYKLYGAEKDPQKIVIDEIAGFLVAIVGLPFEYFTFVAAFVLFRFFDIKKFWPIGKFEKLPRGYGVTLDDVAAGICANIYVWIIIFFAAGGWTRFI